MLSITGWLVVARVPVEASLAEVDSGLEAFNCDLPIAMASGSFSSFDVGGVGLPSYTPTFFEFVDYFKSITFRDVP